ITRSLTLYPLQTTTTLLQMRHMGFPSVKLGKMKAKFNRLCCRCQLSSSDLLTKTLYANFSLHAISQTINIVRRCVNQLFRNKSSLRWTLSSSLGLIRRLNVERSPTLLFFTIGEAILTEGVKIELIKIMKLFKQTANGLINMVYYH